MYDSSELARIQREIEKHLAARAVQKEELADMGESIEGFISTQEAKFRMEEMRVMLRAEKDRRILEQWKLTRLAEAAKAEEEDLEPRHSAYEVGNWTDGDSADRMEPEEKK
jgi:histone acetyltransferase (RNA polymerase elongator complex component)